MSNTIKSPSMSGQKMTPFTGDQGLWQEDSYYSSTLHLQRTSPLVGSHSPLLCTHRPAEPKRSTAPKHGVAECQAQGQSKTDTSLQLIWQSWSLTQKAVEPLPCSQTQEKGLKLPGEADWWKAGVTTEITNVWQVKCRAGRGGAVGSDTAEHHRNRSKPGKDRLLLGFSSLKMLLELLPDELHFSGQGCQCLCVSEGMQTAGLISEI